MAAFDNPFIVLQEAKRLNILQDETLGLLANQLKAADKQIKKKQNEIEQAKGAVVAYEMQKIFIGQLVKGQIDEMRNAVRAEMQARDEIPSEEEVDLIVAKRNEVEKVEPIAYGKFSAKELRGLCKERGFRSTGSKKQLIDRLNGNEDVGTPQLA